MRNVCCSEVRFRTSTVSWTTAPGRTAYWKWLFSSVVFPKRPAFNPKLGLKATPSWPNVAAGAGTWLEAEPVSEESRRIPERVTRTRAVVAGLPAALLARFPLRVLLNRLAYSLTSGLTRDRVRQRSVVRTRPDGKRHVQSEGVSG